MSLRDNETPDVRRRNQIAFILNAAVETGAMKFFVEMATDKRMPQELSEDEREQRASRRAATFDAMAERLTARYGIKL